MLQADPWFPISWPALARTFGLSEVSYRVKALLSAASSGQGTERNRGLSGSLGAVEAEEPRPPISGPEEDEDWATVRRVQEGSVEHFGVLVRKHQNRVYSVVSRILASPEDAEEVASDAFLKAYEKIGTFRGESRFSSWIHRIAMNLALNRLRKVKRKRFERSLDGMIEEAGDKAVADLGGSDDSPVRSAEEAEWIGMIEAALQELPKDYRAAVVLRDVEGFSYEEIAERTAAPVGTVKSRLHTGRALLRKELRKRTWNI